MMSDAVRVAGFDGASQRRGRSRAESTRYFGYRHRSCRADARPRCVVICKRERRDARPLAPDRVVAPSVQFRPESDHARAVNLPWRSNDVGRRSRTVRSAAGSKYVSSRDGLERWSKGGGEKGRGTGPRAFGHDQRSSCESDPRPPNAERAPRPTFGWGERVPSIEPFSPPPLDPPSPVARSTT